MIDAMHLYQIYSKYGIPYTVKCVCGALFITYANGYGHVCTMCDSCLMKSYKSFTKKEL